MEWAVTVSPNINNYIYNNNLLIDTGTCTNGDMRLIDGLVDTEGRLEVCVGGVWGGVCGANFGRSDAYVACSHLGYSGASEL